MSGVYIHIPFCKSKCPYCDFHSQRCNFSVQEDYVDAIIDEITTLRRSKHLLPDLKFTADTLYIGGGTPSVLKPQQLEKIILTAKEKFNIPEDAEITVECNPSSDIESLIDPFKSCGVNRISLGMQSAVDDERKLLGRISDKRRVKEVVELLKVNDIENISLDIMLGVPSQTKESLTETLDFVKECNIKHVSAYILKIEEGTFFDTHRERFSFPSDDEACDLYEQCSAYLEDAGFSHYEISNFAIPGYESKHNTKYWTLEDYLGIGAAAHSFINGKRFYFESDTQSFIDGEKAVFDCVGNTADEYIMLRLRLKEGLNITTLSNTYGEKHSQKIAEKIPFLAEKGLVIFDGETLSLTRKGFLLSNSIIEKLI